MATGTTAWRHWSRWGYSRIDANKITPLFHRQGRQPPWNCFWGTADESQNFVVAGNTALIVHQGTLSGFDLSEYKLFAIHGERDTFGGFPSPAWARNEWHGPVRSGAALDGRRIFWQTGSRVLCIVSGELVPAARLSQTDRNLAPTTRAPDSPAARPRKLRSDLELAVKDLLSTNWAPVFVDPGLAGRNFSFDHAGELFEAMALAYRHLKPEQQAQVKKLLAREWTEHPGCN